MKVPQNREITRSKPKNKPLKHAVKNCYTVEELIRMGNFDWLCIAEGYLLEGIRLGKWESLNGMFRVLNSVGVTYSRASYYYFRSAKYYYIPNPFFSVCASLVGVSSSSAARVGLSSALSIASRYPDRWVIPSYIVSPTLGA